MSNSRSIDMYTLDIEELNKFIKSSTRPNLKRQLEQIKINLEGLLVEEKRKVENSQKKEIIQPESTPQKNFVTVSKYALDSGDKFVK